jgi:peroxiredoxin Q/BCP
VANPAIQAGKRAPAFTLPSTEDNRFRLTEQRGRWVVAFFYRKNSTNGCLKQVERFRDAKQFFQKEGAVVVGIGPGDLEAHSAFSKASRLNFPLLVDRDSMVAAKYGAWREKNVNGQSYIGLVRSTVLIDPSGKIVRVWDNVRVSHHVEKVLLALREERAK